MSQVITNRVRTSRRSLLKGITAAGAQIVVGLPPLVSMFNSTGTAYAAATPAEAAKPIETRFVLWFNGNGVVEKYWIPAETGADFTMTPCLAPLAPFRDAATVKAYAPPVLAGTYAIKTLVDIGLAPPSALDKLGYRHHGRFAPIGADELPSS